MEVLSMSKQRINFSFESSLSDLVNLYKWIDGSSNGYEYWSYGEPNDYTGTENCVEMWQDTKEWNDHKYDHSCSCKSSDPGSTCTMSSDVINHCMCPQWLNIAVVMN